MKRHMRRIALAAFVVVCFYGWGIVTDSRALQENLLRLHVVGASDAKEDQDVKLLVRDAHFNIYHGSAAPLVFCILFSEIYT